jgi:hypothetical protein
MPTIMRLMIAALLWSLSVSPLHGKLASIYPLSADCCCPVSIVANSRPPRQEAHTFNRNADTVTLHVSREKDGKLRLGYAGIRRSFSRTAAGKLAGGGRVDPPPPGGDDPLKN